MFADSQTGLYTSGRDYNPKPEPEPELTYGLWKGGCTLLSDLLSSY